MTRKLRSEQARPRPSAKLTELPSAAAHREAAQYEDDNVGVEAATFIYENDLTFEEYYAYYVKK